jgi:RHS repeat-associated protein
MARTSILLHFPYETQQTSQVPAACTKLLHNRLSVYLLPLVLLASTWVLAQGTGVQPLEATNGEVSLDTLNIHLELPLVRKPGIGLPLNLSTSYNSNEWSTVLVGGVGVQWVPDVNGSLNFWNMPAVDSSSFAGAILSSGSIECTGNPAPPYVYRLSYSGYRDAQGNVHSFPGPVIPNTTPNLDLCPVTANPVVTTLNDGSGLTTYIYYNNSAANYVDTKGRVVYSPYYNTITDPNGNRLSLSGGVITDTFGVQEVTVTGTPASGLVTYAYPVSISPGTAQVKMHFTNETLETNFQCQYTADFPATPGYYFPTSIDLPDGSHYSFTYEPSGKTSGATTGRIASITYPSGELVSYQYTGSNNGMNCLGGTPPVLTRTVGGDTVYKYTASSSPFTTTLVSDSGTGHANNTNVYTFINAAIYNSGWGSTTPLLSQVVENQGASTPLVTRVFCYNGQPTNGQLSSCVNSTTVILPLVEKDTYTSFGTITKSSRLSESFDLYMNVTDTAVYDFGASSPTRQTVAGPYGYSWNGSTTSPTCTTSIGNGVNDKPCQIQLLNGSGTGAPLRNTYFAYDSKGNILSNASLASGSSYLTTSATYYPNGTLATSFDANGNKTTYTQGQCNSGLLTKVVPPIFSLDTTLSWDSSCDGARVMSVTDPNGFSISSTYSDPFWRPTSKTDQLMNTETISYYPMVPLNTQEAQMSFGSSDFDSFNTSDALGRPLYAQRIESASGSWDTTQMGYSWNTTGRVTTKSMPCSTTKGSGCSNGITTATHDALGRTLVVTDGGAGTITNTYTGSSSGCGQSAPGCVDILTVLGPAPAGEVVKQVQKEYNGLGQLVSSCQLSSASGTTSCGQANGGTGYLTTYTYNVDGTLASIVRGVQSRTFTYDALGRTLTAKYPESGTKYFYYDSAPSTPGVACSTTALPTGTGLNVSPLSHLVKTYDANGTTTCFSYDTMNRNTGIAYAGTNWDGENKYFIYDSATVDSTSMTNALGRIAEAYTAPTASGTKATDEGFSYTGRGEVSAFHQWSTNSGGWYVTSATYYANGSVNTLTGVVGGTWTYTLDGKGRPYGATNSINGTMASSVTYNPADEPCVVTLGLGDTDTWIYDGNYNNNTVCGVLTTGRMTSYSFAIGATPLTETGTYSWNANGTLRGLAVVDGIHSANSQTCAYGTSSAPGYDEFGRLLSTVCTNSGGTNVWEQAFTYDMYDNITKSASPGPGVSWIPGYSATNNEFLIGTYDANGNLLTDTFHTYTWNQDNHPHAFTDITSTMTYDAFGRLVEKYNGSAYQQELYSPIGNVGIMAGQTVVQFRMPLPGGDTSLSGVSFLHKDMLGSVPVASTRGARSVFVDRAFAPYGETYNNIGTLSTDESFTGDRQDIAAGTYDTPNRELNPNQGRWISPDPVHAEWNAYAYTTNPLGEIDHSGLNAHTAALATWSWDSFVSQQWEDAGYTSITFEDLAIRTDALDGWVGQSLSNQTPTATLRGTITSAGDSGNFNILPSGILIAQENIDFNSMTIGPAPIGTVSPGDIPGDVMAGSLAQQIFQGNRSLWNNSAGAGNTLLVATGLVAGGALGAEFFGGAGLTDGVAISDPIIANSDKVLAQTDLYHNVGELIGQEAMQYGNLAVENGSYLQWNIAGSVNGTAGVFQYGGLLSPNGGVFYITHTLFASF